MKSKLFPKILVLAAATIMLIGFSSQTVKAGDFSISIGFGIPIGHYHDDDYPDFNISYYGHHHHHHAHRYYYSPHSYHHRHGDGYYRKHGSPYSHHDKRANYYGYYHYYQH